MNAIRGKEILSYLVEVGTPPLVKTVKQLNATRAQLETTNTIVYLFSRTLGCLIHYLSCGKLCRANVCALQQRIATLEHEQALFVKKISQLAILLVIGQVGVWGPSSTMLSALTLHGFLYKQT